MSTASFHARIERINQAHYEEISERMSSSRKKKRSPVEQALNLQQKRSGRSKKAGLGRFVLPLITGLGAGATAGVVLLASTTEGWVFAQGTEFYHIAMPAGLAGLGLAPVLMLAALLKGGTKPGLPILALSYLTGLVLMLLV